MARLMSSTELATRVDGESEYIVVDVLSPEQYAKEHIPGAMNIPLAELEERAKQELNKNQRIVVYGENHDDPSSNDAAEILENLGFRKISDFDGGLYAWKIAGYLTEGSEAETIG